MPPNLELPSDSRVESPRVTGSLLRPLPDRRWMVALGALGLLAAALATIVAVKSEPQPTPLVYVTIGAVFGTLFGLATLAGAWAALGPGWLVWRQPLSLACLAVLVAALGIHYRVHSGPGDFEVLLMFAAGIFAQWIMTQAVLWMTVGGFGVQLARISEEPAAGASSPQFGIRSLMIVTAVIAVLLGLGRILLPPLTARIDFGPMVIIGYLAIAGVLMLIPLLLAALVPRGAWWAVPVVLVLGAFATAVELPLLRTFRTIAGGPEPGHFIGINSFQAVWVLAFAGLVRWGGYRLTTAQVQVQVSTAPARRVP
jgi:hypothetical protein